MRKHLSVIALLLSAHAMRAQAAPPTDDQKLALEAARALYGEGLTVTRAKGKVTIAPKAGGLTQEKWNLFVEKFYLPEVIKITVVRQGAAWRWANDYSDKKFDDNAKPLAAFLLEPAYKADLCRNLMNRAGEVPDFSGLRDNRDYCVLNGIIEATATIFEYTGTAVTWDEKTRDRGDVLIDAPIFVKDGNGNYPMLVTVAGQRQIITSDTMNIVQRIGMELDGDGPNGAKAAAHKEKLFAAYERQLAAVEKQQKKLMGKAKVGFSATPFTEWAAQKPVTTPLPCDSIHFIVYTPRAETIFMNLNVDGKTCAYYTNDGGKVERDRFAYYERCMDKLTPGTHAIEVAVHESYGDGSTYSRLEVRQNKLVDVSYDVIDQGKKLLSGKTTCEAK